MAEWKGLQEKLLLHLQQRKVVYTEGKRRGDLMRHLDVLRRQISRFQSSIPAPLLPKAEDLAMMDPYRPRIFSETACQANDAVASDEELRELIDEWNSLRRYCLNSLLPNNVVECQSSDPLELASVYFSFDGAHPELGFPSARAYAHRVEGLDKVPEDSPDGVHLLKGSFVRPWDWDSNFFFFNHRYHLIAKRVIIAAEGDPLTTTASEMDQLSLVLSFRCLQCSGFMVERQWRGVVRDAFHSRC
jgi:hypothetical protein